MERSEFEALMGDLTGRIAGRALDDDLARWLNDRFPAGSPMVSAIAAACRAGDAAGWICSRTHAGIRYGRVIKPSPATHGFSVDVVDMADVAGGHHVHPRGEIDLVLPVTADARFDGHGAGWCVYGAGSAHAPTVSGGRAYVLYLLPQGAIEFTRQDAR
jgi:hypothetical protein